MKGEPVTERTPSLSDGVGSTPSLTVSVRPEAASTAPRWLVLLALGSAAFTLLGSLVPFEFLARPPGEAVNSFFWAMTSRALVQSRSDGIANVLLGVPLGFALLGYLCVDHPIPRTRVLLSGMTVLAGCVAFAAAVEFVQLFVPARTCAGSDVLAQGLGSVIGMFGWVAFGQRLTNEVRGAATGSGTAGRFLVAYVLLLGFLQALPLDLSLSPYQAYYKFRDGSVGLIPFQEFRTPSRDDRWARAAALTKLAGLSLPVGLLAGCLPGRFWAPGNYARVLLAALALAVALELGQVLVKGRTTSATDALVGAAAVLIGWLFARFRAGRGLSFGDVLGLGSWWLLALGVVSWQPFAFTQAVRPFDWIPGTPLDGGNPLVALEEMLTKVVLFGLGGALVVSLREPEPTPPRVLAVAGLFGLAVSAVFEAGQRLMPDHTPCITDVVLGGLGAFCGAWVVGKVRMRRA